MAAGSIGGGGAAVGSPISGGTASRILYNDSSGNLADSSLLTFNGTEVGIGGSPSSGYRLKVLQAANDGGLRVEGAATGTNTATITLGTSLLATYTQLVSNATGVAGTECGLNNAFLQKITCFNTTGLLMGPADARTWVRRGTSLAAAVGGTIKTFQADVAHDGTGTDVFYTYSIPAASMAVDGDYVQFEYNATFAANANNKTIIVAYGGTTMYTSGTVAKNGGSIRVKGTIWRTAAATQRWSIEVVDDASTTRFPTVSAYGTAAETLSGAVALEFRGTATAASDIVAKTGVVQMFPAGN
jgi:hypothetical protein